MSNPPRLDLSRTDLGAVYPPMGNIFYHADNAYWDHAGEFVRWDESGKNALPSKVSHAGGGQIVELQRQLARERAEKDARDRENAALKAKLAQLTGAPGAPNAEAGREVDQKAAQESPERPTEDNPRPPLSPEEQAEQDALMAPGGTKAPDRLTTEERERLANDPDAGRSPLTPADDVLVRIKDWAAAGEDAKITDFGFDDWQEFKKAVENAYGTPVNSKAEARDVILAE